VCGTNLAQTFRRGVRAFPDRRERNLLEDMGRQRLIRRKRRLQMIDGPVHGPEFRDESNALLLLCGLLF
jgi:hypothetical protein